MIFTLPRKKNRNNSQNALYKVKKPSSKKMIHYFISNSLSFAKF